MLALAGTATAQPATVSIPFRQVNTRMLVDVTINKHKVTLLVDTGAALSIWMHNTREDLVKCTLRISRSGEVLCVGDAPGVAFVSPEKEVHFEGFLGNDAFAKFSSVTFDYKNHVIVLTPVAKTQPTIHRRGSLSAGPPRSLPARSFR